MKRSPLTRKMPLSKQASLARTTALKGGGELKRTPLSPQSAKHVEASRKASPARAAWARAADHPEACAACGRVQERCHGHHVTYRQHVRKHGGEEYDLRNRMPLCTTHHHRHHHGLEADRLPLSLLTEEHWQFARELLGDRAPGFLARYYRSA